MSFLRKRPFALCIAIGEGCALLITLILALPIALLMQKELLPEQAGGAVMYAAAGLSVLAPTIVLVKARGRQALATGGAVALGYAVLAELLCALNGGNSAFGMWLVWLTAAVFAGGLAGALVSAGKRRRKRRR